MSRPFAVAALSGGGKDVTIEASPAERLALAEALGLVAVESVTAALRLTQAGAAVNVTGRVKGVVTQTCTVSLDAFDVTIDEPVDLQFLPEVGVAAWLTKHRPDPNQDLDYEIDPPDAIVDGKIDLGSVMSEFLALGLDPYPRKPGVAFDPGSDATEKDPSPFAALAHWKKDG